jgi:ankyrin repeat protein
VQIGPIEDALRPPLNWQDMGQCSGFIIKSPNRKRPYPKMESHEPLLELTQHLRADDLAGAKRWLANAPYDFAQLEKHRGHLSFLGSLRSRAMAALFVEAGLPMNAVSQWWADGFGLEEMPPEVATFLVETGATLTPHAAAALGLAGNLEQLLSRDPTLAHALGGDGATPLHFARTIEVAQRLLAAGAEIDAVDSDHHSTPAQWRIQRSPDVTRFLLNRGATPDIFMAAGLGDLELAKTLVRQNPGVTSHRIGNNSGPFPGIGFRGTGGSIYQWTLGFNRSPQEIAWERGHREIYEFLMASSQPKDQFLVACLLENRPLAESILRHSRDRIFPLSEEDTSLLAKCCWETNLNPHAVALMLELGFPANAQETNHGFRALHNAAWCGDLKLVELLLHWGAETNARDPRYNATAIGYAIHSATVARRHPNGDFANVVRLLLESGCPFEPQHFPTGDQSIDAVALAFTGSSRRHVPPPV